MSKFAEAFSKEVKTLGKKMDANSPVIFTVIGVMGFVTAAVLVGKGTPDAQRVIEDTKKDLELAEKTHEEYPEDFSDKDLKKEKASLYLEAGKGLAKSYGPAAVLILTSTYCVFRAQKTNTARIASFATAYNIEHAAREELEEKTIEVLGEKKLNQIRDEINKDKVRYTNPPERDLTISQNDNGDMLCYDALIGRYFWSNPNKLHKAENTINKNIIDDMYESLNDFYYELGLPSVEIGDDLGWNVDGPLELYLTSSLTENETPCLVVDFHLAPRYDYRNLH